MIIEQPQRESADQSGWLGDDRFSLQRSLMSCDEDVTDLFSMHAAACCENGKLLQTPRQTESVPVFPPSPFLWSACVFLWRKTITAAWHQVWKSLPREGILTFLTPASFSLGLSGANANETNCPLIETLRFIKFCLCRDWRPGEPTCGQCHPPWSPRILCATFGLLPGDVLTAGIRCRCPDFSDQTSQKERCVKIHLAFDFGASLLSEVFLSCIILSQVQWQSAFFRNGVWAAQMWAVRHGCAINPNILLNIVWVCKSGAHVFLCRGAVGVSEGETCLDCIELKTCNQDPLNSGAVPHQLKLKKSKCNNIKSYLPLDVCRIMLETPLFPTKSSQFLGVVCFSPIYRWII